MALLRKKKEADVGHPVDPVATDPPKPPTAADTPHQEELAALVAAAKEAKAAGKGAIAVPIDLLLALVADS